MIWPITKRALVVLEQPVTCDCVKQAAAPQGPFGPVAMAQVLRLSRSLSAISCIRIEMSCS
jgi:hypothetical protein